MKRVDCCPACSNTQIRKHDKPVTMSAFVMDRMTNNNERVLNNQANLLICDKCGFMGVDVRFDPEEERRYYQNYLESDYNDHRISYEGTMWRDFEKFAKTDAYIDMRKARAFALLDCALVTSAIESVLDYGGNRGELIPNELSHARRYLLEVDERQAVEGCQRIGRDDKVELVMCSHVMEHVSFPAELLYDIKQYLVPNGCVYIEVPDEIPCPKVHEHLNFITEQFLKNLLHSQGFDVVKISKIPYTAPMINSIGVVGQLR